MDIKSEKQNIKALVAVGRVKEAMPMALDFAKSYGSDDDVNVIVTFSCDYTFNEKSITGGQIDLSDARTTRNTIVKGLLTYIDTIETDFAMLQRMRA